MVTSLTSAESAIISLASLNPISAAIANLYCSGKNLNEFMDQHIVVLQQSDNPTVATTGRILEAAKFGFGLGYLSSVAIIAVGQLILGNSQLLVQMSTATVGSSVLMANPVAMTCGAVGAVCYGWAALSGQEQEAILNQIKEGLEVGVELIKSLIQFVLVKIKDLLDSKYLLELKEFVALQAQRFGKTLSDITRATGDRIYDTVNQTIGNGKVIVHAVTKVTNTVVDLTSETTGAVANKISMGFNKVGKTAVDAKLSISNSMKLKK